MFRSERLSECLIKRVEVLLVSLPLIMVTMVTIATVTVVYTGEKPWVRPPTFSGSSVHTLLIIHTLYTLLHKLMTIDPSLLKASVDLIKV